MKINLTEAFDQVRHYFPNEKSIDVQCQLSTSSYQPEPTFSWVIRVAGFTGISEHFSVALANVVSESRVKAATTDVVIDTDNPSPATVAQETDLPF